MISLETKQAVFTLWFIKGREKREISRTLNISRGTVYKVIQECQDQIVKLNLSHESNLLSFMNVIILPPVKQHTPNPYKLNEETLLHIKKLVQQNEKLIRLGSDEAKSTKQLFLDFKKQHQNSPNLTTDFTLDCFYKYAKRFKLELYESI